MGVKVEYLPPNFFVKLSGELRRGYFDVLKIPKF
jgi:hypothetical protein